VRAPALGREHVHLPRIVVQLDPRGGGNGLALLDQVVHEVAEIRRVLACREMPVVRQPGERGNRVDSGVEDQLRPLCGQQVGQRFDVQAGARNQRGGLLHDGERRVLVGAEPRLRVEHVLDVRVGVARPAHERHARDDRPRPGRAHRLLGPEAVQHGHDRRLGKAPAQRLHGSLEPGRLGRDDAEVERRDLIGIGGGVHARLALTAPADVESVAAQGRCVVLAPGQYRDVRDGGQMPGKEAADRTCAYDAHPLHPCR